MNSLLQQLAITLRLHLRNKMGLLYGYLFPTFFLIAFWVLYRHDSVPLVRHMGELLTVTILGGACFGLPTTMVSERERGVWRRYRLAPVPTGSLVTSTLVSRYLILITAGLLQIALAMAIGMPLPLHPFDLWVAFTIVAFAFLGLGLVIAMLADNVPAVQALGQCIFLPMLIIGGVAVPLESLPGWAQHVAAYFPGIYAVEALQVTVNGDGLGAARFSLLALVFIGAAGCLAGAKMFRWEAHQRFSTLSGKRWVAVALMAWVAVGLTSEFRGQPAVVDPAASVVEDTTRGETPEWFPIDPQEGVPEIAKPDSALPQEDEPAAEESLTITRDTNATPEAASTDDEEVLPEEPSFPASDTPEIPAASSSWQAVSMDDIEALDFNDLPPDEGLIAPIARVDEQPNPAVHEQLECIRETLPRWVPGLSGDPVQRVRNQLYVAAVPDMFRMEEVEGFVPLIVFDRLEQDFPEDELIKILYWIAIHPDEGDDTASDQLRALCLDVGGPSDVETLRERKAYYALKLLGRVTGHLE